MARRVSLADVCVYVCVNASRSTSTNDICVFYRLVFQTTAAGKAGNLITRRYESATNCILGVLYNSLL